MFKDRLLTFLRERGMSQVAFARRVGVTQESVSQWTRGHVEPRLATYQRIIAEFPELAAPVNEHHVAV